MYIYTYIHLRDVDAVGVLDREANLAQVRRHVPHLRNASGLGVWGCGFGVWGRGFGVRGMGFGVRSFEIWGSVLRVWGLGSRASVSGIRV